MTKMMLDSESLRKIGEKMFDSVDWSNETQWAKDLKSISDFCIKILSILIISVSENKNEAKLKAISFSNKLIGAIDFSYDFVATEGDEQ